MTASRIAAAVRNVELLKATLAHIEAHPEEWDQAWYRCRSGMCYAGWAATLAGGRWAWPETAPRGEACLLVAEPDDPGWLTWPGGLWGSRVILPADRARRVLGLDLNEGNAIFHGDNTIDDLRRMVGNLVAGRPINDGADE